MFFYGELLSLYSSREKGLYAEQGGYYDQPNCYNKYMQIVDSAVSEASDMQIQQEKEKQENIEKLRKMGLNNKKA
jgi:hypothetical protein